ncbi:hypothetical protein J7T55_013856 [Diaporthe amygdali]|uniref:uncharacterized protein n=1 Tax=Phomopsis amygdali TaxID=1214568 RepID=UPI0022FE9C01|nr:uncharacterized protein J7T55_013856 [Diaporthe amygdali]KAJ0119653.1 hypothetical protein J7T55_013856 [Diaporthe amygdali]
MRPTYKDIIESDIIKFVIGPNDKEFNIHSVTISSLSKPLGVLINGNMREATERCVKWPDVDEKTFVRFAQWAYTETYVTEEPDILLDHSVIGATASSTATEALPQSNTSAELPLYSLLRINSGQPNKKYGCFNYICGCSALADCATCAALTKSSIFSKRDELIDTFLDQSGSSYPTSSPAFSARPNTESCENYTGVFLCHAKLYVLGDKYDIPALKQLSLHRLHATLKEFTLYPNRMSDIATLTKYVFQNTVPEDEIRDMITLYYACIVEDASKQDGLESLIDEIPDFAFGLIRKMSERLA